MCTPRRLLTVVALWVSSCGEPEPKPDNPTWPEAGVAGADAGSAALDCTKTVDNRAYGTVVGACVHEIPAGSSAAQEGELVVVRADGGVVASYERCPCLPLSSVAIVPAGTSYAAFQPAPCMLAAADYDQSCLTDADCVAVALGDLCSFGAASRCNNGVISRSALEVYERDLAVKRPYGTFFTLGGCPNTGLPACTAGTCRSTP